MWCEPNRSVSPYNRSLWEPWLSETLEVLFPVVSRDSPTLILQIQSLHNATANFFACYDWARCENYHQFINIFTVSFCFLEQVSFCFLEQRTFPWSNLVDSKLKLFLSKGWWVDMLLAINWNEYVIACVRQHSHTATQWHTPEGEATDMFWVHQLPMVQSGQSKMQVLDQRSWISNMERIFFGKHHFVVKILVQNSNFTGKRRFTCSKKFQTRTNSVCR